MVDLDEHFAGVPEAWLWVVPHPGDADRGSGRLAQSRIGTGSPDAFVPVLELRSATRMLSGGRHGLRDLTGSRRSPGSFDVRYLQDTLTVGAAYCEIGGVRGHFQIDGQFVVGDAEDRCTIATRGTSLADIEGAPTSLRSLRPVRAVLSVWRAFNAADAAMRDIRPVVDGEAAAFDGWLTATQHRTAMGEAVAESWRVVIDHDRPPPAPLGVALVLSCAALCHRSVLTASRGGDRPRPAGPGTS